MDECTLPPPSGESGDDSPWARYHRYAWENCVPISVMVELTHECNLHCGHCYNCDRGVAHPREKLKSKLLDERIHQLIGEIAETGAFFIVFTGGEPLLHPELLGFMRTARERGLMIRIKTNGTCLTRELAARFSEIGVAGIDISLYGGKRGTHDDFTGVSGSFERAWEGLRVAKEFGLNPRASFILHRKNFQQLSEMIAGSEAEGISYEFSTELTKRHDGSAHPQEYGLTESDLTELLSGPHGARFIPGANPTGNLQCSCARTVGAVSVDGEVYPCIGAPIPSGRLQEKSFGEIWRESPEFKRIRSLTLEDFKDCRSCDLRWSCLRSSGAAYVNTGDYTGADPGACLYARVASRFK